MPRRNDLLHQLGKSKYFSILDPNLDTGKLKFMLIAKKNAFITHKGLFKFRVMPFEVTNAPAVFQRLMQQVLARLQSSYR